MIENEVKILRRVNHPNIIQLIAEQDTKSMLYLVVEYVKGNSNFTRCLFIETNKK